MNLKNFLSVVLSLFLLLVSKYKPEQEIRLNTLPKLTVTELDFGREAVTFCMHEGIKIRFKLVLNDFVTSDLKVEISQGAVGLEVWDMEGHIYLMNPKAETFKVDIWVKEEAVQHFKLPTMNGQVATYNEYGNFQTTNAIWKPIAKVFEVKDGYIKVISSQQFYGRVCE